jgi:hypothetical protein
MFPSERNDNLNLADFDSVGRRGAVTREVDRWGRALALRGEDSRAYHQAEAVLERLGKMPLGWWRLHAQDSVTNLLALVPCGEAGCGGLVRPGYAAVCRRAGVPVRCATCGGVGAEEVPCG